MTIMLMALAVLALLMAVFAGYVGWRDRRRSAADEDRAATARAEQHRWAAQREHPQGDGWNQAGSGYGA
jgi:uncharacterized iron-regulated membrane protein